MMCAAIIGSPRFYPVTLQVLRVVRCWPDEQEFIRFCPPPLYRGLPQAFIPV